MFSFVLFLLFLSQIQNPCLISCVVFTLFIKRKENDSDSLVWLLLLSGRKVLVSHSESSFGHSFDHEHEYDDNERAEH